MTGFRRLVGRVREFGWLPLSQAIVFVISTASFAVFARLLGPEPYARFAYLLLIFTAVSLVTDLSPQGFTLVRGPYLGVVRVAHRLAAVSAVSGAALLTLAMAFGPQSLIPGGAFSDAELVLVLVALLTQVFMQVPRAILVISKRYGFLAIADIGGTVFGITAAFLAVSVGAGSVALLIQLTAAAVCRSIIVFFAAKAAHVELAPGARERLTSAVRYGLRVIPLNLASYLGRSLDSGLLPALVSPVAAAGYSRSYQVVVTPLVQLQLSVGPAILERFARAQRVGQGSRKGPAQQLWNLLQVISVGFGLTVILLSPVIEAVLFGPQWPLVQVTIVAMASCLPGIAIATFGSWMTQIEGGRWRTVAHFLGVLATPVAVLAAASLGGFQLALSALVCFGGIVQPLVLAFVHRRSVPAPFGRALLLICSQWVVMAALFVWISSIAGFWSAHL